MWTIALCYTIYDNMEVKKTKIHSINAIVATMTIRVTKKRKEKSNYHRNVIAYKIKIDSPSLLFIALKDNPERVFFTSRTNTDTFKESRKRVKPPRIPDRSSVAFYRRAHRGPFLRRTTSAARVACSKTSLTPSFVLAEHSR